VYEDEKVIFLLQYKQGASSNTDASRDLYTVLY
jgi:hypothetical protein